MRDAVAAELVRTWFTFACRCQDVVKVRCLRMYLQPGSSLSGTRACSSLHKQTRAADAALHAVCGLLALFMAQAGANTACSCMRATPQLLALCRCTSLALPAAQYDNAAACLDCVLIASSLA